MAAPPSKPSPSNQPVVDRSTSSSSTTTQLSSAASIALFIDNDNKNNIDEGTATCTVTLKDPPTSSSTTSSFSTPAAVGTSPFLAVATTVAASKSPSIIESSSPVSVSTSSCGSSLTYERTESSQEYILAKELLSAGTFEEALSVIEQAIESTKTMLWIAPSSSMLGPTTASTSTSSFLCSSDDYAKVIDLHESLAPLHYLYGTTLLYSLEEAKDDGMMGGGGEGTVLSTGGIVVPSSEEPLDKHQKDDDDDEEDDGDDDAKPAATAVGMITNPWAHLPSIQPPPGNGDDNDNHEDDGNNNNDTPDDAEDIQIAWENLEAARTIVEEMITRPTMNESRIAKLKLDLAQIMLREGDLQRLNGRYISSIQDYKSCLDIRQLLLDRWDRKIADAQFNLGLTYMSSSSELQKELAGGGNTNNDSISDTGVQTVVTPNAAALAKEHSKRGIERQVECARTLCGIIAKLCGIEPEQFVQEHTTGNLGVVPSSMSSSSSSVKPVAGFKTTGLDDEDDVSSTAVASQTVSVLRKKVALLISSSATTTMDPVSADQVYDIQQVLDEIQETIDEAERSLDAIRQAVEIRTQAQRAAAFNNNGGGGSDDTDTPIFTSADGVTTSIGFGKPPPTAAGTASSIGVLNTASTHSVAAATASTTTKPMMVIKKKAKRKEIDEDVEHSLKPPADHDTSLKRAKIED